MSQALKPPTGPSVDTQTGIDLVITIINDALRPLPWLAPNGLGRIVPQWTEGGKLQPWLYRGQGEYYLAYPNDTLPAMSCLYAHDDEQFDESGLLATRTLSLIVWANLSRLGQPAEALKQQVVRVLREVSSVTLLSSVDGQNLYPSLFDLTELKARYLTHPYGGFRIELRAYYTLPDCYETTADETAASPGIDYTTQTLPADPLPEPTSETTTQTAD